MRQLLNLNNVSVFPGPGCIPCMVSLSRSGLDKTPGRACAGSRVTRPSQGGIRDQQHRYNPRGGEQIIYRPLYCILYYTSFKSILLRTQKKSYYLQFQRLQCVIKDIISHNSALNQCNQCNNKQQCNNKNGNGKLFWTMYTLQRCVVSKWWWWPISRNT